MNNYREKVVGIALIIIVLACIRPIEWQLHGLKLLIFN
jgi:hypothetical protein